MSANANADTTQAPGSSDTLQETERIESGPGGPGRGPMGGGMIGQKANSFGPSTRRLVARMRPERHRAYAVVALTVVSVVLSAIGPKILGRATDLIFSGLIGGRLPEGTTKAEAIDQLRQQGEGNLASAALSGTAGPPVAKTPLASMEPAPSASFCSDSLPAAISISCSTFAVPSDRRTL